MSLLVSAGFPPRLHMSELEFWSEDHRFGFQIAKETMAHILKMCEVSKAHETGGILVGFYTTAHDCAVVTAVSKAPSDSQSGRMRFVRGARGLQRWLEYLWRRKQHYYLGEWHFHPYGFPYPSQTDIERMSRIADTVHYRCPEPVLLIVGGDPTAKWNLKAYVFPKGKGLMELVRTNETPGSQSEESSPT
jgi:integrative and conjugative element protein (TIGR02256 family)